ncbi:hypothetical protein DPMN_028314 [Dreissena polymorpha]|uniref:Uncharacterized protein n=1 Tax=Dreissena polymorpha TaxID=45954 RepID=A0A9D4RGD4_DREPO|nr:hypothetical protein DPMN_028314 [Dreissena polymorpha]
MCYHGHCRLLLERRGTTVYSKVNDALCDDGNGRELLSSDLYVNNWSSSGYGEVQQQDRVGPSIPLTHRGA